MDSYRFRFTALITLSVLFAALTYFTIGYLARSSVMEKVAPQVKLKIDQSTILAAASAPSPSTAIAALFEPYFVASSNRLSLCAVGDVNPGSRPANYVKEFGYPYLNIRNIFHSADLTFGNLECALSSRGRAIPGKKFTFRGSPDSAPALKGAGFDVFSVSNNHSKDFGNEAFLDTLEHLKEAQLVSSGGGKDISEAYRPSFVEVKSTKIAFLSFSDVLPAGFAATESSCGVASIRDQNLVFDALKKARNKADFVIVSVHWGIELSAYPSRRQTDLAHELIDGGADMVLGHHPHVIQGMEVYNKKLIAYSLGNFMFSPGNPSGRQSMFLIADIEGSRVIEVRLYPVYIYGIRPEIISGKQGQDWLNEIARRSQRFRTPLKLVISEALLFLRLVL